MINSLCVTTIKIIITIQNNDNYNNNNYNNSNNNDDDDNNNNNNNNNNNYYYYYYYYYNNNNNNNNNNTLHRRNQASQQNRDRTRISLKHRQDIQQRYQHGIWIRKICHPYRHRGEVKKTQAIELPNRQTVKELSLEESYKYLGILQADDIKHEHVKKKTTSKYLKRVCKVLKSKLNGGNTIQAINSWAAPVIRYAAAVVD